MEIQRVIYSAVFWLVSYQLNIQICSSICCKQFAAHFQKSLHLSQLHLYRSGTGVIYVCYVLQQHVLAAHSRIVKLLVVASLGTCFATAIQQIYSTKIIHKRVNLPEKCHDRISILIHPEIKIQGCTSLSCFYLAQNSQIISQKGVIWRCLI